MPQTYLCFLWHMHQPFYKDLITGEYKLPWTRMHALKDYYGMARILEDFPHIRQTFNLVPSLMVQVEEYASGKAVDPFLDAVRKPAESLTDEDRAFLLRHSFYSDPRYMIHRYPRYGEIYDAWQAQKSSGSSSLFGTQDFRDLQMWSQLAWFDEEFKEHDEEVRDWIARGRNFSPADKARMVAKQQELVGQVAPEYKKLAATGQIEISTTPYYHPILPLLCDSDIASVSHPGVTLPPRFQYPGDAHRQLALSREFIGREFGVVPAGLWPSEGSVSDEVFSIAAELGYKWAATDSEVLNRTMERGVSPDGLYRPYRWSRQGKSLAVIFRDHLMSDLIGFVYSKMDAGPAADDFLHRIRENCAGVLASGRDALVPIILDGENAWEYYPENGRPFLRELYRRIQDDPRINAVTVSEAISAIQPAPLDHIFPASWIGGNFDVWIGADEDNEAWSYLLQARETYDTASDSVPEDRRQQAFQELLIAEGSDWCWWYGPEHESTNRPEFDQLFRSHLANVYRFLNLTPPEELSRPILHETFPAMQIEPSGSIKAVVDGEVTSYFEWMGAGIYRVDERSGAMHGRKFLVKEMYFGSDGEDFYLRVDFQSAAEQELPGVEARLSLQNRDGTGVSHLTVALEERTARVVEQHLVAPTATPNPVECAFIRVLELRISLAALGIAAGGGLRFQCFFWKGSLPVGAVPDQDWLEMRTTDPAQF